MEDKNSHLRAWNEEYRHVKWGGQRPLDAVERTIVRGSRILDVGCGNGRYLLPLSKNYDVVGIDVAPNALKQASAYLKGHGRYAECIISTMTSMPFLDGSFDAVVCFGVLQHLFESERKHAMEEIKRVLRPSGILFFEVFGIEDMRYGGQELEAGTFRRKGGIIYHYFTEQEITLLLGGFTDIDIKSKVTEKIFHGQRYTRHHIQGHASLKGKT